MKIITRLIVAFFFLSQALTATAQIVILADKENSAHYLMAKDMKEISKISVEVVPGHGGLDDYKRIEAGQLTFMQLDVLQNEQLNDLKTGQSHTDSIKILIPLGKEQVHLIVRESKGINQFSDLNNPKIRVGVGLENQSTYITVKQIKKLTNSKWEDKFIDEAEALQALMNDEIDAFFIIEVAPISQLTKIANLAVHEQKEIKLISISDKRLDESYPRVAIKADTYEWADYDIETLSIESVLVANTLSETSKNREDFEQFITDIKANISKLQKNGKARTNWRRVSFSYENIPWSLHSTVSKITQEQKQK